MARTVTVKVGTAIPPAEQKKIDKNKVAMLRSEPPNKGGVEGQYPYQDYVFCPYCPSGGWAWIDTDFYTAVYCGSCNGTFYS